MSDQKLVKFEVALVAFEWTLDNVINELGQIMKEDPGEEWVDFDAELKALRQNFADAKNELFVSRG